MVLSVVEAAQRLVQRIVGECVMKRGRGRRDARVVEELAVGGQVLLVLKYRVEQNVVVRGGGRRVRRGLRVARARRERRRVSIAERRSDQARASIARHERAAQAYAHERIAALAQYLTAEWSRVAAHGRR